MPDVLDGCAEIAAAREVYETAKQALHDTIERVYAEQGREPYIEIDEMIEPTEQDRVALASMGGRALWDHHREKALVIVTKGGLAMGSTPAARRMHMRRLAKRGVKKRAKRRGRQARSTRTESSGPMTNGSVPSGSTVAAA